jgi:Sulfotransferase domain
MIVWLASFPRSGNSLFRATLYQLFGVRSGSVFPERRGVDPFLDDVSLHLGEDSVDAMRDRKAPVFVKTHRIAEADDPSPAIYLVRDGRDALVSYAHFVKERGERGFKTIPLERVREKLIERENHPYGSWSANVRAWTRREAPTALVRFEELVESPARAVRDAAASVGISLREPSGELPSFKELHEKNPIVFRRGRVGSWRSELEAYLEERFWELHGAEMLLMGYSRGHPLAGTDADPGARRRRRRAQYRRRRAR